MSHNIIIRLVGDELWTTRVRTPVSKMFRWRTYNGQGKVREFDFFLKVRDFFKMPISIKICCYCRLSRMFVTVFTNMKVHMSIFNNVLLCSSVTSATFKIRYRYHTEWRISDAGICLIYLHMIWIDNQLSIKWSGKFLCKSGKNQGIFFQMFGRGPCGRKLYGYFGYVSSCFRNTGWSTFKLWHLTQSCLVISNLFNK